MPFVFAQTGVVPVIADVTGVALIVTGKFTAAPGQPDLVSIT
jgi:hypothetical protein